MNKNMKVSLIIAVYKDVIALDLIIESLKNQTYKNFEVIIAEDGESDEMKEYIRTIEGIEVKHTIQEDMGVRKARSQNNGILASTGEYIIFIDGDCPLFSTFIEGHISLAKDGFALSGRRLNLDNKTTQLLRANSITPSDIENSLFSKYLYLAFDKNTRFEQGIHLNPNGFIYKQFISKRNRNTKILGCNFSCWKKDIVALNGFDESYGESAVSDDMDWDWRFEAYGLQIKSCKNVANMMHLLHKAHDRGNATKYVNQMNFNKLNNRFMCEIGLNSH